MKRSYIRKAGALAGALGLISLSFVPVYADGGIQQTDMADEYEMMEQGTWPTEVTFSDTCFSRDVQATGVSVLSTINNEAAETHSFTLKAGEKISFEMIAPQYNNYNYYRMPIQWKGADKTAESVIGFGEDGVYLFRRAPKSCTLTVTDFGFEKDLSDLSGQAEMTIELPAVKVMSEEEYNNTEKDSLHETLTNLFDGKKESDYTETVHVRAQGNIVISPYYNYRAYRYLGGNGDPANTPKETDSVGFSFVFEEGTPFEVSLNDGASRTVEAFPDYYDIWAEEPGDAAWEVREPLETLYYYTPSIVLVDSDLVERTVNVSDEWEAKYGTPKKTEETAEPAETEAAKEAAEETAEEAPKEEKTSSPWSQLLTTLGLCVVAAGAGLYLGSRKKK